MSTPEDAFADRAEERLAHDAGLRPETAEDRTDAPEQLEKDAGRQGGQGIHTDVPEQLAKDAGSGPEIVGGPHDVPEQIEKDAGEPDRG